MTEHRSTPSKIDRRLTGDPIAIDGRQVQPVARVHGRWDVSGNQQSGGAGGRLNVQPLEVLVREADGSQTTLALVDPNAQVLRTMVGVAAGVALACAALSGLARVLPRR